MELSCHSAFSFLDGASDPESLVERAAALGIEAVALTDFGGVYGAPRFFQAARKAGIRPIVGAEIDVRVEEAGAVRIALLACDRTGYGRLCRLLTEGHAGRPKGACEVPLGRLEALRAGLLATVSAAEPARRTRVVERIAEVFPPGDFGVRIVRHGRREQERENRAAVEISQRHRWPRIACNDVRYAAPAGAPLYDVMACLRAGCTLASAGRRLPADDARHLRPPEEAAARFADLPDARDGALAFAARCVFTLRDLGYRFPDAPLPPGRSSADEELRARTYGGAADRYRPVEARHRAQLERELAVIAKLGLAGYFLVVHDIVLFCRARGILAQGRGSAANSAVCYVLGITAVDPVGMDLLFERFLSEERGEWPDIDIDLPSGDRRESVIRHVYERYGPHGAAMTANVITWRSRLALREAAKAIGLPPEAADRAAKHAPGWGPFPIEARAGLEAGVRDAGLPDAPETRLLVDVALALRGLPRHLGQHSGGMIVAGGRLDEIVPLEPAAMPGRTVVQWDKDDCGDLGILKIDLLGLGMLRVLERTVPLVREHEGVEIDLAHLPKDDPITYRMLRQADTIGVFQLESRAQMATLPRMRPERFYDLVVEVALIRPGPIVGRMVNPYLERRAGREPVRYPHPSLEPILRRTLGVPLFQEQLMRVAMTAAGFTGGEAEELRRALGAKRSVERMAVMETKLRAGMKRLAIPDEAAEEIVRGISGFAMYGFPESHAASFALIAYASAFLHAHHPAAFGCALLDAWPMGFYHPATLVKDMQRHGVRVFPIDVFRSAWACGLEAQPTTTTTANASAITNANTTTNTNTRVGGPAVRLGLKFARGLREQAGRRIEAERRRAPFVSIADLARRTGLDAREIDGLAEIGALAGFGLERREAIWQAGRIARGDGPLWEGVEPEVPLPSPLAPMSPEDRTLADYRGTGLTVGVHPIGRRRLALSRTGVIRAAEIPGLPDGRWVKTAGIVIVRQRPATAKGFFFLTLEDETGLSNAVVTPDRYEAHRRLLVTAAALVVEGPLQNRDGVATVKVRRIEPLGRIANTPGSRDFR